MVQFVLIICISILCFLFVIDLLFKSQFIKTSVNKKMTEKGGYPRFLYTNKKGKGEKEKKKSTIRCIMKVDCSSLVFLKLKLGSKALKASSSFKNLTIYFLLT